MTYTKLKDELVKMLDHKFCGHSKMLFIAFYMEIKTCISDGFERLSDDNDRASMLYTDNELVQKIKKYESSCSEAYYYLRKKRYDVYKKYVNKTICCVNDIEQYDIENSETYV